MRLLLSLLLVLVFAGHSLGSEGGSKGEAEEGPLTVAVASNAFRALREIALAFEETTGVKVTLVHGSTGKLYTQIVQGAPFHLFLAADRERPALLGEKGYTKPGTRFTYVRGVPALWSAREELAIGSRGLGALTDPAVLRVAIANPETAPYGKAAVEALKSYGIFDGVKDKLVYGENVSQAFSFASTGNADAAFVSLSTIYGQGGDFAAVAAGHYAPVVQDGVILKHAPVAARSFADFLGGRVAQEIFLRYGYRVGGGGAPEAE